MSNRDKLAELLANRERDLTQQQRLVAEAIFAMSGTFSAEEIVTRLHE
jgi:Fe2+ or Zn2+ uptake regulation protein